MTAEEVLSRVDYLLKYEARLQPLIDNWEEAARKRYHCEINHCPIKERVKWVKDCLADTSEENNDKRSKLIHVFLKDFDIFNMVDHLLRHNGPEPWEAWNYVDQIRARLCFLRSYMPPLVRENIKDGQCKNTGLWTHEYYKDNKKIPGRKKADLCPCSACRKLREMRRLEIAEYRAGLKDKKNRKKKDPMRYR